MTKSKSRRHGIGKANRHIRPIDAVRDMFSDMDTYITPIITKYDKKRDEATRLIKEWEGMNNIDIDNIDEYLTQIRHLHKITTGIIKNLEYVNDKPHLIPYMSGEFAKINDIIASYNDYIDSNPLVAMKYSHLEDIDVSGVQYYGKDTPKVIETNKVKITNTKKAQISMKDIDIGVIQHG